MQRQINNSLSVKVDYVGSGSHRTNIGGYYNTALTPGPGDPQTRAPYPYATHTLYDHGIGSSTYNALQVSLDKRYTRGLSFQVAYTWSESFTADDGWFNSEGLTVQDAYHPGASTGYAGTNVPQVLAINTLYDIPVGPGRRFSTGNRFGDYILGNWQLNNIFNARSGQNQTVVDSADIANIGNPNTYERANQIGNPFSGFTKSKYGVVQYRGIRDSRTVHVRELVPWSYSRPAIDQFRHIGHSIVPPLARDSFRISR